MPLNAREYTLLVFNTTNELYVEFLNKNLPKEAYGNFGFLRSLLDDGLRLWSTILPDRFNQKIDLILQHELSTHEVTLSHTLPKIEGYSISVWRGDITLLHIDCIVSSDLNFTVTKAGPRLQDELRTKANNRRDSAILTLGYNVPARYIMHIADDEPQTYMKCLNKMKDIIKYSIAIDCDETNFELLLACAKKWLDSNKYKLHIVLCVPK